MIVKPVIMRRIIALIKLVCDNVYGFGKDERLDKQEAHGLLYFIYKSNYILGISVIYT